MKQSRKQRLRDNQSHIAFLLTHGFAARSVLRAEVSSQLVTQGAAVTVISPNAEEPYFQRECQRIGVNLRQEPGGAGRIADWFRTHRSYLLHDVTNNPALAAAHGRRFAKRPISSFTFRSINRTLARLPQFRRLSRVVECTLNRSRKVRDLLVELRPDLLVLPNPFGRDETVYLLEARSLGIPVVCQMLSWDNVTSKGTPLLMPEYFISWGPIMTNEIVDLYHFAREKVYECGVPHFDVYSHRGQLTPRKKLLTELHLSPEQPYIFYGMVPQYSCPNEIEILEWLVSQINRIAFAEPCSLVIRPHPQTISGVYASMTNDLKRLKALVGPRVALDTPPVLSEKLAWDLPKNDMYRLASLMAGCAMCLNANSTLCLDACMLDRPVINIAFDGWRKLPYEKSARRGMDYFHMAKLLSLGGIRVARSFSELERLINTYLRDPILDQERRFWSATQECGPCDGSAAERVAATLLSLTCLANQPVEVAEATVTARISA